MTAEYGKLLEVREGNTGEDVRENSFLLGNTQTRSYMQYPCTVATDEEAVQKAILLGRPWLTTSISSRCAS
jgi:hypothetical protein